MKSRARFCNGALGLVLASSAFAQSSSTPQQTLVYVAGTVNGQTVVFPGSNFQFQNQVNLFWNARMTATEPSSPMPATIQVAPLCLSQCQMQSTPGTVFAPMNPWTPDEDVIMGVDYMHFGHEFFGHQSVPPAIFLTLPTHIIEAWARMRNEETYRIFAAENSSLFPTGGSNPPTSNCAMQIDTRPNENPLVFGGAGNPTATGELVPNYYANLGNDFAGSCAIMMQIANKLGGVKQFDHLINQALPANQQQFDILMDSTGVRVDGLPPSFLMNLDPGRFASSPVGTYLGVRCDSGSSTFSSIEGSSLPINPPSCRATVANVAIDASTGGRVPTAATTGQIKWTLSNASGALYTEIDDVTTRFWYNPSTYPTGGYKISACYIAPTASDCSQDPRLSGLELVAVLNGEKLNIGDAAVVVNGPRPDELTLGRESLVTRLSPSAGATELFPNLVIYRGLPQDTTGNFEDLSVSDGTFVRTYTLNPSSPAVRHLLRQSYPILLGLQTDADAAAPTTRVVPGMTYTLTGWGFTQNAPTANAAPSFDGCPGSATNDEGRTQVFLTAAESGKQYPALIKSCSFQSIDIQIPLRIPAEDFTISVVLNGTPSVQTIPVTISNRDRQIRRPW
jgi:hypothetical protein